MSSELSMKKILDKIRAANMKRDQLLDTLALWNAVTDTGINHDDVQAFSFRTQYLTMKQIKENNDQYRDGQRHDVWTGDEYHNCVIMKTGEILSIPMTKRPVK